ncbi:MAG: 23S rRNA (uracil(1939)-C(5))-methyltransferase RlmD, partial [Muribaculaceae bacterium]|nr:23S rRNA (uracil(1939)-C(5))-methyltransferase RlmD [Muribaculaceae bacterium]
MARKRKELPILKGVKIADIAAEGNAVARVDDMVVFVPFAAPGDVVDVKIDRKRRNYAEGHIDAMVEPSPIRVVPRCEHFTVCGGCRWQHLPYDVQLDAKRQQVVDAMRRIAKVEIPEVKPTLGSGNVWEYRNKMEYTFSNKRWLTREQLLSGEEFADRNGAGFHIPGAFDKVLDINRCFLQDHLGDRIRLFIKKFALSNGLSFYDLRNQQGLLRTLMVRIASTGQVMVVMSFGQDDPESIKKVMDAIASEFPEITSLMYVVNLKVNDSLADQDILLYKGVPHIEEEMEGLKFRVGPKSFYQTNSAQAYELYSVAREFAQIKPDDLVYDLYTGTGTIANFVARGCRQVIGIEYVEDAIRDARINSQVNGIDNTLFYAGDMKDVLTDEFIEKHGRPDVMIVDPPRAGMHQSVVDTILRAKPQRIVYVSCNPATQARDIALLDVSYKVTHIQPVDM